MYLQNVRIFSLSVLLLMHYISIAQSTANNNVSTFIIGAPQLENSKKIWVYLPSSYGTNEKNYPVLYLQDAQNLFDASTSYVGEWEIDETLDSLGLELIVIGIEHGNDKRIDELTPFPHPEHKGGRADAYLQFIVEILKPEVDSNYRTEITTDKTFIGGSSLGGLFSFYACLEHPEIFGKAIVFSPSFWYSEEIFNYVERLESKSIENLQFYFRAGEKESETMLPLMLKMKNTLSSKLNSEAQINIDSIPKGEHNEVLWKGLFPNAALWLMDSKE